MCLAVRTIIQKHDMPSFFTSFTVKGQTSQKRLTLYIKKLTNASSFGDTCKAAN